MPWVMNRYEDLLEWPAAGNPYRPAGFFADVDWRAFVSRAAPHLQNLIPSLNSTALVDRAETDVASGRVRQQAINARSLARRGLGVPPALAQTQDRADAIATTNIMNNARLQQRDRNTALATNLATTGNQLRQLGMTNALGAASIQSGREMYNEQQQTAATNTNLSIAAMIAMMMASSEQYKDIEGAADPQQMLEYVVATPIYHFTYKPEHGIAGDFIGPITEQTPEAFVSEDGLKVKLYNMVGSLFAAVQALNTQVQALSTQVQQLQDDNKGRARYG